MLGTHSHAFTITHTRAHSSYFAKLKGTVGQNVADSPLHSPSKGEGGEVLPDTPTSGAKGKFTRRFFLDNLREGKLNFMKHFDILLDGADVLEAPQDYLRVYYTDFLQTSQEVEVLDTIKSTPAGRVEIKELREWVAEQRPRTRMDAYPMMLMSQHLLGDMINDKMSLFLAELEQKKTELTERDATIAELEERVEVTRAVNCPSHCQLCTPVQNTLRHLTKQPCFGALCTSTPDTARSRGQQA